MKAQDYVSVSAENGFLNITEIQGKNLYEMFTEDPFYILPAERVVGEWHSEMKHYDFSKSESDIWNNHKDIGEKPFTWSFLK